VLTTLGAAGSEWGEVTLPGLSVTVVDTTGAGDSYCGTLAAALVRGEDNAGAMRAATEASARAVTYDGAQPPLAS
jgi:ribokinase